jgi:hypothetical protein
MRVLILTALIASMLPSVAFADGRGAAKDTADPKPPILERRLPELRFDQVGFSDVIDFLRDVTGANIFVNWKKIEAAGIDRNTPVSARMRDIPFQKALKSVLDNLSDKTKLGFVVDDDVITISTAEDLGTNVVTRVYDVRYLDNWRKNAAPATQPSDAKDPLVGMITGSIATASWGKTGEIKDAGGQLVVTATEENHKAIANLLDNLKRLAK